MNQLLNDLLGHQVWADAEHWRAIGGHARGRDDRAIRDRLHHIHQVQRFFVWAVADRTVMPAVTKPDEFASFDALASYAREAHDALRGFMQGAGDARLGQRVEIPWFRDPPLTLTVSEALTQMAMHSHYHRGQNAARLREIGGEPPPTDLIVWYWKGRPAGSL